MPATVPVLTPPRPFFPSGRSGRVGWCVLAALGLHAALGLGLFLRTQTLVPGHSAAALGGHAHLASTATASAATAMQVRWAVHQPSQHPLPAQTDTDAATATAPSTVQPLADAAGSADTADATTTASSTAPTSASASADSDTTFTGYARRDMLDRAPQALGIVQISYPPGVEPGSVRTGRLTLFIDEAGAVRKVLLVSPADAQNALPAPFVEAAREAFLQARFAPGERQGMPVKSRIDVEVSFDGRETDPIDTAQQPNAPAGTDRSV